MRYHARSAAARDALPLGYNAGQGAHRPLKQRPSLAACAARWPLLS